MKLNIEIKGIDEAIERINMFDITTHSNVRKEVRKSALRLGRNMRNRTPVDSGNLKKSIKSKFNKDGLGAEVGPTYGKGSHAHLVEFGHQKVGGGVVPGKPFITPAREEEKPKIIAGIKAAIKGASKL